MRKIRQIEVSKTAGEMTEEFLVIFTLVPLHPQALAAFGIVGRARTGGSRDALSAKDVALACVSQSVMIRT